MDHTKEIGRRYCHDLLKKTAFSNRPGLLQNQIGVRTDRDPLCAPDILFHAQTRRFPPIVSVSNASSVRSCSSPARSSPLNLPQSRTSKTHSQESCHSAASPSRCPLTGRPEFFSGFNINKPLDDTSTIHTMSSAFCQLRARSKITFHFAVES
jgi:hypothetical protein